jgi:predicted transcriptional regulator
MKVDPNKVDEAALAILYLTLHDGNRAWKALDLDLTDRLHSKGLIANPANKAKSVIFTEEGLKAAQRAYRKLFSAED